MAYRIYVTDSLQLAPQSKFRTNRYADIVGLVKVDKRSGDEIAAEVIKKHGLVME